MPSNTNYNKIRQIILKCGKKFQILLKIIFLHSSDRQLLIPEIPASRCTLPITLLYVTKLATLISPLQIFIDINIAFI